MFPARLWRTGRPTFNLSHTQGWALLFLDLFQTVAQWFGRWTLRDSHPVCESRVGHRMERLLAFFGAARAAPAFIAVPGSAALIWFDRPGSQTPFAVRVGRARGRGHNNDIA